MLRGGLGPSRTSGALPIPGRAVDTATGGDNNGATSEQTARRYRGQHRRDRHRSARPRGGETAGRAMRVHRRDRGVARRLPPMHHTIARPAEGVRLARHGAQWRFPAAYPRVTRPRGDAGQATSASSTAGVGRDIPSTPLVRGGHAIALTPDPSGGQRAERRERNVFTRRGQAVISARDGDLRGDSARPPARAASYFRRAGGSPNRLPRQRRTGAPNCRRWCVADQAGARASPGASHSARTG